MPDPIKPNNGDPEPKGPSPAPKQREKEQEKEGVGQWVQRQFLKHALPWTAGGMMAFPDMVEDKNPKQTIREQVAEAIKQANDSPEVKNKLVTAEHVALSRRWRPEVNPRGEEITALYACAGPDVVIPVNMMDFRTMFALDLIIPNAKKLEGWMDDKEWNLAGGIRENDIGIMKRRQYGYWNHETIIKFGIERLIAYELRAMKATNVRVEEMTSGGTPCTVLHFKTADKKDRTIVYAKQDLTAVDWSVNLPVINGASAKHADVAFVKSGMGLMRGEQKENLLKNLWGNLRAGGDVIHGTSEDDEDRSTRQMESDRMFLRSCGGLPKDLPHEWIGAALGRDDDGEDQRRYGMLTEAAEKPDIRNPDVLRRAIESVTGARVTSPGGIEAIKQATQGNFAPLETLFENAPQKLMRLRYAGLLGLLWKQMEEKEGKNTMSSRIPVHLVGRVRFVTEEWKKLLAAIGKGELVGIEQDDTNALAERIRTFNEIHAKNEKMKNHYRGSILLERDNGAVVAFDRAGTLRLFATKQEYWEDYRFASKPGEKGFHEKVIMDEEIPSFTVESNLTPAMVEEAAHDVLVLLETSMFKKPIKIVVDALIGDRVTLQFNNEDGAICGFSWDLSERPDQRTGGNLNIAPQYKNLIKHGSGIGLALATFGENLTKKLGYTSVLGHIQNPNFWMQVYIRESGLPMNVLHPRVAATSEYPTRLGRWHFVSPYQLDEFYAELELTPLTRDLILKKTKEIVKKLHGTDDADGRSELQDELREFFLRSDVAEWFRTQDPKGTTLACTMSMLLNRAITAEAQAALLRPSDRNLEKHFSADEVSLLRRMGIGWGVGAPLYEEVAIVRLRAGMTTFAELQERIEASPSYARLLLEQMLEERSLTAGDVNTALNKGITDEAARIDLGREEDNDVVQAIVIAHFVGADDQYGKDGEQPPRAGNYTERHIAEKDRALAKAKKLSGAENRHRRETLIRGPKEARPGLGICGEQEILDALVGKNAKIIGTCDPKNFERLAPEVRLAAIEIAFNKILPDDWVALEKAGIVVKMSRAIELMMKPDVRRIETKTRLEADGAPADQIALLLRDAKGIKPNVAEYFGLRFNKTNSIWYMADFTQAAALQQSLKFGGKIEKGRVILEHPTAGRFTVEQDASVSGAMDVLTNRTGPILSGIPNIRLREISLAARPLREQLEKSPLTDMGIQRVAEEIYRRLEGPKATLSTQQISGILAAHRAKALKLKKAILESVFPGREGYGMVIALLRGKVCGVGTAERETVQTVVRIIAPRDREQLFRDNGFTERDSNLIHYLNSNSAEKTYLSKPEAMLLLGEKLPRGSRPRAAACTLETLKQTIEKMQQQGIHEFYIKPDSCGGNGVLSVKMVREGICEIRNALHNRYEIPLQLLQQFLASQDNLYRTGAILVEETIPILRTEQGRTWELRYIANAARKASIENMMFMKIAPTPEAATNNIGTGGEYRLGEEMKKTLDGVIRMKTGWSEDRIVQERNRFLVEAAKLGDQTMEVIDERQVTKAKRLIKREDFAEPGKYDAIMSVCFGSVAHCVDITGVWNGEGMQPVVIESQDYAGLPNKNENIVQSLENLLQGLGVSNRNQLLMRSLTPEAARRLAGADWTPRNADDEDTDMNEHLESLFTRSPLRRLSDPETLKNKVYEGQKLVEVERIKVLDDRDFEAVLKELRKRLLGKDAFSAPEIEQLVREGAFGEEIVRVAAEERTALEGLVQEDVKVMVERFRVDPGMVYRLGNVEVLGKIALELGVKVSDGTNVGKMQEEIAAKIKK